MLYTIQFIIFRHYCKVVNIYQNSFNVWNFQAFIGGTTLDPMVPGRLQVSLCGLQTKSGKFILSNLQKENGKFSQQNTII